MAAKKASKKKTQKRKPEESDLPVCPHCGEPLEQKFLLREAGKITGRISAEKLASERGSDFFKDLQSRRQEAGWRQAPKGEIGPPEAKLGIRQVGFLYLETTKAP